MRLLLAVFGIVSYFLVKVQFAVSDDRITNGELAKRGQFPYLVGLNISLTNSSTWCGGTLISHRWIATAAHCVDNAEQATIYLGALNITDRFEFGQMRYTVDKSLFVVHPNWTVSTVANDIALIKLPVYIPYNSGMRAAQLPKDLNGTYATYDQQTAYASGWGRESDSSLEVSPTLRYVAMPVMQHARCKMYWGGSLTEKMLCMSTQSGKSTCHGDSGGPLVYKENDTNYLIGITSFGLSMGCEIGFPSIFTRLTSYLDWIRQHAPEI